MVRTDAWRVGLVLRNLAEPTFGPEVIAFGGNRYRLERHARLGVAVFPRDGLTLAADADLMPLDTADGRRRTIAVGVEQRAGSRVVAPRRRPRPDDRRRPSVGQRRRQRRAHHADLGGRPGDGRQRSRRPLVDGRPPREVLSASLRVGAFQNCTRIP